MTGHCLSQASRGGGQSPRQPCRLFCLLTSHPTLWLTTSHWWTKSTTEGSLLDMTGQEQVDSYITYGSKHKRRLRHPDPLGEDPTQQTIISKFLLPCLSSWFLNRATYPSKMMTESQQFNFLKGGNELPLYTFSYWSLQRPVLRLRTHPQLSGLSPQSWCSPPREQGS